MMLQAAISGMAAGQFGAGWEMAEGPWLGGSEEEDGGFEDESGVRRIAASCGAFPKAGGRDPTPAGGETTEPPD